MGSTMFYLTYRHDDNVKGIYNIVVMNQSPKYVPNMGYVYCSLDTIADQCSVLISVVYTCIIFCFRHLLSSVVHL